MRRSLVMLGLALSLALAGVAGAGVSVRSAGAPPAVPAFAHIYQIIFENHESSAIVGSSQAPYLNALISQYGLATDYDAVAHPSQPNYLAIFSGSTQGITDDGIHSFAGMNLADQIESSGRTWRVFAQNVPLGCSTVATASGGEDGAGSYARKHEPAISFSDINGNASRCADISDFSHFDPAAADYELIVPNLCDDMHSCSVSAGDSWLRSWLPSHILDTPTWQNSDSLLLITWDEGTTNLGGGGSVPLIVLSKHTPAGFTSAIPHTHYSLLRTIEDAWNLGCLSQSCAANDLSEFFAPGMPTDVLKLPGRIEAENYRSGGEGVGYHDTTPGNIGGVYRNDGVDIQTCSDPGTLTGTHCYNVGWIAAGEWLGYDVYVGQSGSYRFTLRVAAPNHGASLHLEIDGSNASGPLGIPDTSAWQSWRSVTTAPVWLSAGPHLLQVMAETEGFNLDYVDVTPSAPATVALPGRLEAEDYQSGGEGVGYQDTTRGNAGGAYRSDDVDLQTCGDHTTLAGDSCYNVGWIATGEWLAYQVNIAASGSYIFSFRVATPNSGTSLHVELDGVNVSGPIAVPNTEGWQIWTNVASPPLALPSGTHTLRLSFDAGSFNLNRVDVTVPERVTPAAP